MNQQTIEIVGNQKTYNFTKGEYARWLCLIEAIDLVERKAAELKQDINTDDSWVKPLAFQKYIEQRFETMILDVNREEGLQPHPSDIATATGSNSSEVELEIDNDEMPEINEELAEVIL